MFMTYKNLRALSIVLILLLQACSNAMQTRNISPYYDGVLKLSDEPVGNAEIFLSVNVDDPLCYKSIQNTKTNELGEFSLKPATEKQRYVPFLNFTLDTWTICAKYKNQRYTLYSNNRYDTGSVAESHFLNCDLTKNPIGKLCSLSYR